jgi:hypothetical protein
LAGEWVEKVEGLTNCRFEAEDGVGSAGERLAAGAQGGWPRCGTVRRGSGLGGSVGGVGTVGRPCGTALRHWTAATSARGGGARAAGAGQDDGVHRRPRPVGARPLKASAAGATVWASFLGMRTRTLAGAPGRRTGDGPLVLGMARTGGAEHDAFPAFKASGGEP